MAFLKSFAARAALASVLASSAASGCGSSQTYVDYVETDTFVSSSDPSNHSELPYTRVSLGGAGEERALLKLPTGKGDTQLNLSDVLSSPEALILAPYLILIETFAEIFDCRGKTLAATLLNSAYLDIDVTANSSGIPDLDGQVTLQTLSRPWWQDASWASAHGFSSSGGWAQAGGDVDSSVSFPAVSHESGKLRFDVTAYLRTLLSGSTPHYGLRLRASGASLGAVTLASVQYGTTAQRPRLVSSYNCITPTGSLREPEGSLREHTFILGLGRE